MNEDLQIFPKEDQIEFLKDYISKLLCFSYLFDKNGNTIRVNCHTPQIDLELFFGIMGNGNLLRIDLCTPITGRSYFTRESLLELLVRTIYSEFMGKIVTFKVINFGLFRESSSTKDWQQKFQAKLYVLNSMSVKFVTSTNKECEESTIELCYDNAETEKIIIKREE